MTIRWSKYCGILVSLELKCSTYGSSRINGTTTGEFLIIMFWFHNCQMKLIRTNGYLVIYCHMKLVRTMVTGIYLYIYIETNILLNGIGDIIYLVHCYFVYLGGGSML